MAGPSAADIEAKLLQTVHADGCIADSGDFAKAIGVADHNVVVGVIKSLEAYEMLATEVGTRRRPPLGPLACLSAVLACAALLATPASSPFLSAAPCAVVLQDIQQSAYKLSAEGRMFLEQGAAPEVQVFDAVPATGGIALAAIKQQLGETGEIGFRQAMQQKLVGIDKSSGEPLVVRKVQSVEDKIMPLLRAVAAAEDTGAAVPSAAELQQLAKRKLVALQAWKTFRVSPGPKFALERRKPATDLTADMLQKGTWREETFKEYNFQALGLMPEGGYLHPLLKVRTQFRKIFTQMGFEEMPTNNYVESSFWNFDVLFQPQQHPARDAHDTFFLTSASSLGTLHFAWH